MNDEQQTPDVYVTHDAPSSRFLLTVDGTEAGFAEYTLVPIGHGNAARDFHHTEIYPQFRGHGYANPLVKAALNATRVAGLKVQPTCSAVSHFIVKNPEFADLVVPGS
ncbi:GNAT family N-acetyltransferase [Corynebacterium sp.]|uniref:GNAT family N-acetyltransferase n=1 Tax=Corynebacterium sp. TaxID=1720 RepID=UPI0026DB0AF2|nr:GNAT family N-acetyltransferase [Corynebacterium sp.]MDO5076990.1 GNAT family N-acetyltransferase [Corynebacterium sp.]